MCSNFKQARAYLNRETVAVFFLMFEFSLDPFTINMPFDELLCYFLSAGSIQVPDNV